MGLSDQVGGPRITGEEEIIKDGSLKENPFHGSQVISVFIRIDISGLGHLFKTFAQGSHGSHSSHQLVMKGGHCTIRKLKEMEKISPICCTVGNF